MPEQRRRSLPQARVWDGKDYQARFDALAEAGAAVHGEADFVAALGPESVLDAGCGTGRVAIELARRGVDVVGVDVEPSMIAAARARAPDLDWLVADLAALDLGRVFDVVVMAGNVLLFTPPGTQGRVVAGCARHVHPGGVLVCGMQLDRGYDLATYDDHCAAAGLEPTGRWATWARAPYAPGSDYAVSAHSRPMTGPLPPR